SLRALQFLITTRRDHDSGTRHICKLEGKDCYSSGSLDQHDISGLDVACGNQGTPGGQRRARQCCGLLISEMFRHTYDTLLIEYPILSEHSIDRPTKRAHELCAIRLP